MHQLRARARCTAWLSFALVAALALWGEIAPALAQDMEPSSPKAARASLRSNESASRAFGTANSNCLSDACDTVWVGHSNAGPGGAFMGVGVGGTWDFDTGIAGTDSTQGWRRWAVRLHLGSAMNIAVDRPYYSLDYGNQVNEGNTALWAARDLAGRKYIKTGVAGIWHSDTMAGVKLNVADGAEPSATALVGTRSAWCGIRESGNQTAVDALTGNFLNGDLIVDWDGALASGIEPEYPGYCNNWDQILYKDFASTGTGTVAFRVRTEMSNFVDTVINGSGWFNPDPTSIGNFVNDTADSFMVYVGSPNDVAYDTNRRWFSEVLDFSNPVKELFATSGTFPYVSADTALSLPYSGITTVGGKVRVAFRVHTNRVRADQNTGVPTGFNTKVGAALIDAVQIDGGTVYGFETAGSVTARSLIPDLSANGGAWATTGRPPSTYMHIANLSTLIYEDLCGAVGAPTRQCDMAGNVIAAGDKDNGYQIALNIFEAMESPTIDLAVRNAAPGTKNAQGIDQETASRASVIAAYDWYSGYMAVVDESVFWWDAVRVWGPGVRQQPISHKTIWSGWIVANSLSYNPNPECFNNTANLGGFGFPGGQVDSLKAVISVIAQSYRFGGTNLGNTRGTYFDNFRVGLIREPAPTITWNIWDKYQDTFPFNEGITPGDNATFDTTTALIKISNNIVNTENDPGEVAGDSLFVQSPYVGNGSTTGTRLDLIFRIDPGPGNYTTKGNRASALVNKDPAHPFFASYLANNGAFGTPGGHGGTWNRNVWNSARMDSAEVNIYPIIFRGIGGPTAPGWMGTLHELDPRYNALGISHNVCFLDDPEGPADITNISCTGVPPAAYGAVSGTTIEGTKILPDGWFTPGTHIEYFVRQSVLESPGTFAMQFDTSLVFLQDPGYQPNYDAERWGSVDVLPDMWKSGRYLGGGLACMLMIDDNDRRGADRAYRGAADTLGYGKNNGATAGWKGTGPAATTAAQANNPAGFVAANLGQYGLNFDHYDIGGAESQVGGHPGVRFANNLGAIAGKGDKSGPSSAQLNSLYSSVLFIGGDNDDGTTTLHDGLIGPQGADDVSLFDAFLTSASGSNHKSIWLSGDGIMQDAYFRDDTKLYDWITGNFGSDLVSTSYKISSGSPNSTVGFLPTAPWAHPGRVYGFDHRCFIRADVLSVIPTVDGATEGAQYQNLGPAPYTASIYRPLSPGVREFRTLIDGFDLSNVKGNYANLGQIATLPETDNGRMAWFDDVWTGHFQLCARRGPVVAVGEIPGTDGRKFSNVNLGAFPNPAFAGRAVTLRFTLAKAQDVTIRIYNVAGREVANLSRKGVEGPNSFSWDGALSTGGRASAGVYFYAIDGIRFEGASKAQKMILLGAQTQ